MAKEKTVVYVKTDMTKEKPKSCMFIGFTAEHPDSPTEFYYEDGKHYSGLRVVENVTHWLKKTEMYL